MRLDVSTDDSDGAEALSIRLLSSFHVVRNGEPVDDGLGRKGRQLLKILSANRWKRLPKDLLTEMMWPESDPEAATISLKVAAHNLRNALEPDKESREPGRWVIADNGTYRLNPDADIRIDVERFRAHRDQGRASLAAGADTTARLEFEKAEELYVGDYLEEDTYEDWTIVRREELRDLYLDTLGRLASLALAEDIHSDVIGYCHKIILADPCREDAYQMLMRSHGALNQIARAGSWYAVCRSALQRQIGTLPNAETVSAFEELFADREEVSSDLRTA